MFTVMKEIQDAFNEAGLKNSVEQVGSGWVLRAGINGKSSTYTFFFIKSEEKGCDVTVRAARVVKFPKERRDKAFEVINNIQMKYRFIRLTVDDEGNVDAGYDFPMEYDAIGPGSVEILIRLAKILDDVYPEMMHAIWG